MGCWSKLDGFLKVLLALLVLAVFHYNLPQRDIVRITGTEILRKDLSGWTGMFYAAAQSGETQTQNRRFEADQYGPGQWQSQRVSQ